MNTDIQKDIYMAQCIGNVEPIEYMIPYPSMRSLIEGQNIKFSNQVMIKKPDITNIKFYGLVQQTANWLDSLGLKPKQRIIIPKLEFPQAEILLYGIWHFGAIAVLPGVESVDVIKSKSGAKFILDDKINLFDIIKKFSEKYIPKYKPLLDDEALLTFEKHYGIRLSHYNLLANANGIQKAIDLKSQTRIFCYLHPVSTAWVVFKAILPIYCGCIYDSLTPELTIGNKNNDYNLRFDLINIKNYSKKDIAICPENTAALSIGRKPLDLTQFNSDTNFIRLNGHSVTMGYLDNTQNKLNFKNGSLYVSI